MVMIRRLLLAVSLVFACVDYAPAQGEQAADKKHIYEKYARTHFSGLNRKLERRLDPLFSQLANVYAAHDFITDDETRPVYKELLVAALEKSMQGNILDGMFADLLLSITPPDIVVETVVPELGVEGRLRGILDLPGNDVRKHVERQSQQGYPGDPDFRHYASYLSNHKDVESSAYLIKHMFKSASGEALRVMIAVQYQAPYPPLRLPHSASANRQIRPLLYAEHIISDVIWHEIFRFAVAEEQIAKAKSELKGLSNHDEWWVRLYVAEIMQQHPALRVPDVVQQLKNDKHELVKQAITRTETGEGLEGRNAGWPRLLATWVTKSQEVHRFGVEF